MTKTRVCLTVSLAALALVARIQNLTAQVPSDVASFQQTALPFLSKNCFACHNQKLKSGNLNLDAVIDPQVWDKVLEKVSTGQMPPPGMPAPSHADTVAFTTWIAGLLTRSGFSREGGAGASDGAALESRGVQQHRSGLVGRARSAGG